MSQDEISFLQANAMNAWQRHCRIGCVKWSDGEVVLMYAITPDKEREKFLQTPPVNLGWFSAF